MPYAWQTLRARVAALARERDPDDADLVEARRDLCAARLEMYAKRAVHEYPITEAQRDRVVNILFGRDTGKGGRRVRAS